MRKALAVLREMAGGDFAAIDEAEAEATAMALLPREGPEFTALGRAVLQCYYRDERVIRSLGLEPGRLSRRAILAARATGREGREDAQPAPRR